MNKPPDLPNFPYTTEEEVRAILNHNCKDIAALDRATRTYQSKFNFYQNSRFYKDNQQHRAHLNTLNRFVTTAKAMITEKGGSDEL